MTPRHACFCHRPLVSGGVDDDERTCSRCRGVVNPDDADLFLALDPPPGTTHPDDLDWSTFGETPSPLDVPRLLGRG